VSPQFWWYVARATGLVAWALAIASVLWGVALATKALGNRPRAPWLLDLHRHLGGLTVLFVGAHIGALVADSYAHFGTADVLVPFASSWRPGAVAWGVVAFWLLLGIEVTSLLGRRVPKRWWRRVHTAGADATTVALRWATIGLGSAVAFFLLYRELGPKKAARTLPSRSRPATADVTALPVEERTAA